MKIRKHTNVVQAIWSRLSEGAKWALLAHGIRPESVTLGQLRALQGS